MWHEVSMVVVAYLLGSIPSALIFVRMAGKGDVRTIGSGNVGATNALRAAGWKVALPVMAVDIGKGVAAVLLMRWLTPAPEWHAAAGLAAILGHCFPVWLGFSGGKGMATAGGIFLVLAWLPALAAAALWIVLLVLGRRVSLASVLATAAFPPLLLLISHPPRPVIVCAVAAAAVIVFRHRSNLVRLVKGTEPRIGEKHAA
ncbi:MAG TPA: glycerol-3-phosphate 1-O-acyltransferase PlsY [Thermoanaerobaculaceae bacterium]|nr:glycerol-3-phosphate 1-O-acyltransferase PlsY [Thermoanaerobaculaceae bacterium]HRS16049.1 glycerol-3-phosphate 1-O-acyltransferase PlsY [Thermoanaerobaculaceae bacterium]